MRSADEMDEGVATGGGGSDGVRLEGVPESEFDAPRGSRLRPGPHQSSHWMAAVDQIFAQRAAQIASGSGDEDHFGAALIQMSRG